jgi:hypothetical protein
LIFRHNKFLARKGDGWQTYRAVACLFFVLTSSINFLSAFYQHSISILSAFYQHSISFLSTFQFCKDWKEIRKNRLSFAANSVLPHRLITYPPRAKNTVKTKIIKKLFGSYKDFLYLCSRNKDNPNNNNNLKYTADTDTGTANTAPY